MSWANIRGAIQAAIDALTPGTVAQGLGDSYRHSKKKQIDDIAEDRGYLIRKNNGTRAPGTSLDQPGDYLCDVEVMFRYIKSTGITDDEDRIADDGVQVIEALLPSIDHADWQCWITEPEQIIDEDDNGNYIATITGRCRYKG